MLRTVSLALPLLLASGAFAQKTKADVREFYTRFTAAERKGDVKAVIALLEKHLAPDFVSDEGHRKVDRKRFIARLRDGMSGPTPTILTAKVLSAKVSGKSLVFTVAWNASGKDGEGKPYSFDLKSVDTWTNTTKGYRFKSNVLWMLKR